MEKNYYDYHLKRNSSDSMAKAYVNPYIVKCVPAYSNSSHLVLPKNIHINPNFRGHATFLQNGRQKESGSVHINPYFGYTQFNYSKNNESLRRTECAFHKDEGAATMLEIRNNNPQDDMKSTKIISPYERNNIVETYTIAKNSSKIEVKNTSSQLRPQQKNLNNAKVCGKSLNIRTRHKVVNLNNVNSDVPPLYKNDILKRKLLNRYKLINVGKSGHGTDKIVNVNNCGGKKILNSGSENVKDKTKTVLPQIIRELKMKHSFKRNSSVNRIKNIIKTKYFYHNKTLLNKKMSLNMLGNTIHKLDERLIDCKTNNQSMILKHGIWSRLVSKTAPPHRIQTLSCFLKSLLIKHKNNNYYIRRNQGKLKNDNISLKKCYPNRTIIKIGGIMYKSTLNKLMRAKKREPDNGNNEIFLSSKKKNKVIYVRGEKFLLDASRKTLIRQPKLISGGDGNTNSVKRIDLGGVTYIQKSNNLLIQTNSHCARQFVHSAKQRSIAFLKHLHKRNNMPCLIYQRFGICNRQKKGTCIYVHNPKNIDLCKKFLRGECYRNNCPLSHDAVKEKVATCHFFLKGKCNKEDCQYLHVKVNSKAVICRDFLQGFCDLGQNCNKRHVHCCPEYDERGVCGRGAYCPYPHKIISKKKTKILKGYKNCTKFKLLKSTSSPESLDWKKNIEKKTKLKNNKKNDLIIKLENSNKRKIKIERKRFELKEVIESEHDSIVECIPKRVKLTELPLFIPLDLE